MSSLPKIIEIDGAKYALIEQPKASGKRKQQQQKKSAPGWSKAAKNCVSLVVTLLIALLAFLLVAGNPELVEKLTRWRQ